MSKRLQNLTAQNEKLLNIIVVKKKGNLTARKEFGDAEGEKKVKYHRWS